jgi:hypothetical protein
MPTLFRLARFGLALTALVAIYPLAALAEEGFWLFNRIPKAEVARANGVTLTDEWLGRVQRATLRFPGGSGSFVSPDGLVLTNHHVAMDILQKLSTSDRDLVKNGYLARDRAEEIKAPDLELLSLDRITDVSATVNQAVKAGMPPADRLAAQRAAIATIEKDAEASTGLRAEVVTLYQGAQYHLYLYRKFDDVRLVFAPEFDAAFFGGDPDNFTFPRYCFDMTLFRVYSDGRPLQVKDFLRWSTAGTRDGDPVFTSGHPGQTQRLNTVAHLDYLRDHALPLNIDMYGRLRDALEAFGNQGEEQRRQASDLFFSLENSLKSWRGQLAGLESRALMEKKRADERRMRGTVTANPDFKARFGDAWDLVAQARRSLLPYNLERVMFEGGFAAYSEYFTHARTIVRWADESQKPNGLRLPEYTDARKPQIERQIGSAAPIYPGFEQARLAASFTTARLKLGADHPLLKQMLEGKTPQARAAELVAGTSLGDASVRKTLFAGGPEAVKASTDPFIALARLIEPRSRELRTKYDNEVLAVERDAYGKIAQAVFAVEGDRAYPDGTFTLRLSYGQVKGYRENGREVRPFTQIGGLFERAEAHRLAPPYKYPETWAKARGTLVPTTPYNFVTTNDIVGGNSGSPVISASGELVGLIFDGNIHSLPGYFVYEAATNRAIAVDVRGMLEALTKVYKADVVVAELTSDVAAPVTGR